MSSKCLNLNMKSGCVKNPFINSLVDSLHQKELFQHMSVLVLDFLSSRQFFLQLILFIQLFLYCITIWYLAI